MFAGQKQSTPVILSEAKDLVQSRHTSVALPPVQPTRESDQVTLPHPSDPKSEAASTSPQAAPKSTWQWVCDKVTGVCKATADHLSRLGDVKDLSGLYSWAGNVAKDAWAGIKNTANEIASMWNGSLFER